MGRFLSENRHVIASWLELTGEYSHPHVSSTSLEQLTQHSEEIRGRALREYKASGAETSRRFIGRRNIRSFKVDDLPLYWMTGWALKHPNLYWGLRLFQVKQFLIVEEAFVKSFPKVVVCLPWRSRHLDEFFEGNFSLENLVVFQDFPKTRKARYSRVTIFGVAADILRTFRDRLLPLTRGYSSKTDRPIGLEQAEVVYLSLADTEQGRRRGGELCTGYPELRIQQLLAFPEVGMHKNSALSSIWDTGLRSPGLLYAFRTTGEVLKVFWVLWATYRRGEKSSGRKLPERTILFEMLTSLPEMLVHCFYRRWLTAFAELLPKGCAVIYDNEFYREGRIVSESLERNPSLSRFGFQHGVFTEAHTVYSISDEEIDSFEGERGLPKPDYFLTWGDFFSQIFLSHNSLPRAFCLEVCSPQYLGEPDSSFPYPRGEPKLLWCIADPSTFSREASIVLDAIKGLDAFSLLVRLHPRDRVGAERLDGLLRGVDYRLDTNLAIRDSILDSDIVLTSGCSTVALDVLSLGRPSITIVTIQTDSFSLSTGGGKFMARTGEELRTLIQGLLQGNLQIDYSQSGKLLNRSRFTLIERLSRTPGGDD